jgi:uncharacterized membrane protein
MYPSMVFRHNLSAYFVVCWQWVWSISAGDKSTSVIESEGTGIDQTTQHPKIILGIIVHALGHPLGIGEGR